jgi:hypothetical protein
VFASLQLRGVLPMSRSFLGASPAGRPRGLVLSWRPGSFAWWAVRFARVCCLRGLRARSFFLAGAPAVLVFPAVQPWA